MMIKIQIAKLGQDIVEIELAEWSTVMQALKKASYNLDEVLSVKKSGAIVSMDAIVSDWDALLVSQEKVKSWMVEEEVGNVIKIGFTIVEQWRTEWNKMIFVDTMSTFEIVKLALRQKWESVNNFVKLTEMDWTEVSLWEKLEDGKDYKIIVADESICYDD